jgi:transcriptional regulator with XRE-family HTH domain
MAFLTQDEIGRRIAELRGDRGVSQRQLAEAVGIDPSAMSRVESGERGLAVGELVAVAEHLGVTTDAILQSAVEARPLFRTEAGEERVNSAVSQFGEIIDDFFTLRAAAGS